MSTLGAVVLASSAAAGSAVYKVLFAVFKVFLAVYKVFFLAVYKVFFCYL